MDGYRVGEFPPPWVEWNDQYRDTIRDFWRGQLRRRPRRGHPAGRLVGPLRRRRPLAVRLGQLRHRARRLHRCATWCPTTTSTTRPTARTTATAPTTTGPGTTASRARPTTRTIVALRRRQAANLMATLCLSNGVPMITAGDERGRTQRGNNNAYCQDNEISWVDWRADDAWLDVYEVTKTALRLRREHPALRQRHWFEGRPTIERRAQGPRLAAPARPRDDRRRLARRRAARRRHVRLRRPAALPRPARRAAVRQLVHDLAQRRGRPAARSRCPRTTGCQPARSCSPPTPTTRSAPRRGRRRARPRRAAPSWSCARPDVGPSRARRCDRPPIRERDCTGDLTASGERDDAELGDRGEQVVARDDADGVAERAASGRGRRRRRSGAAAVVGLGQRRASRPWSSTRSSSPSITPCTTWTVDVVGRQRRRARRRRGRSASRRPRGRRRRRWLSTCSTRTSGQPAVTCFFQAASSAAPA